jgi:hypothetical protein
MTPKQEEALREYLQEGIVPLIEQVLVKKLGQAMLFAADQLMQPKREWVGLTDEDKEAIYEEYVSSPQSFIEITEAKLKEKNA